ncbi:Homeobox protein MOX-2 [Desmophyllum pertusum]|uniref:Homeobox protein MOX-2 n=1 Tax=Desmophyllum pertusum TaxID=174260 RepID=A0A9X0D855_9CNID|nr:Homeobox protein MOX-2 [Desmophyllum pertusum]
MLIFWQDDPGRDNKKDDNDDDCDKNWIGNEKKRWGEETKRGPREGVGVRQAPCPTRQKSGYALFKSSIGNCKACVSRPNLWLRHFTHDEVQTMEQEFTRDRYVSKEMRAELASKLSLTEKQVKKWFENRRQKEKRSKGRNGKPL